MSTRDAFPPPAFKIASSSSRWPQVPVLEPSRCSWNRSATGRQRQQLANLRRPLSPRTSEQSSLPVAERSRLAGSCRRVAPFSALTRARNRGDVERSRGAAATDMAAGRGNVHEDASGADLYAVLGLNKECTDAELRVAYRRLAMIWHPDRCSASGSSARVEEAKERFQEIQGAYSVLSDSNKRLLYDVGVYDCEDDEDDASGMGDFLGEMADMMSQATPTESFEELQQLFVDMFQDDIMAGICGGPRPGQRGQSTCAPVPPRQPSSPSRHPPARTYQRAPPSCNGGFGKRGSSAMGSGKPPSRPGRAGLSPGLGLSGFCFKVSEPRQRPAPWMSGGEGRSGRKQRLSTSRDVSDGFSRQSRASWQ